MGSYNQIPKAFNIFRLGYIINPDGIPFMISVSKPYVLGTETVWSWFENHTVLGRRM